MTAFAAGFADLSTASGQVYCGIPLSALTVCSGGTPCSEAEFVAFASRREQASCTCPGRNGSRQGRHRIGCPRSIATLPRHRADAHRANDPSSNDPSSPFVPSNPNDSPPLLSPPPPPEMDAPPLAMPSWLEVSKWKCNIVHRIPREAVEAVSYAFTWTCARLKKNDAWTWLRLYMFSKCVLRKPPRGGKDGAAIIRRRALRWRQPNGWIDLWHEATASAPPDSKAGPQTQRFPVDSDVEDILKHNPDLLSTSVDADSLPADVVERAIKLAKLGFLARAASALAAAQTATPSEETAAAMRAKHPQADAPLVSPAVLAQAAAQDVPVFSERSVLRCLRSFKLGSASGLSGLTMDHLISIATASGVDRTALPSLLNRFAKGQLPPEAAPFFCGARLVALVKTDGDYRPIAIGDALRRLTARLLLQCCKKEVATFLASAQQVGVGVSGGLDSVVHTARRVSHAWHDSGVRGRAFLKLDFKNAFNQLARDQMIDRCATVAPVMLPFVLLNYMIATVLLFGSFIIWSMVGAQQGDPLGPPLYAIAFAFLWFAVVKRVSSELMAGDVPFGPQPAPLPSNIPIPVPLEFAAWYLDDGSLADTLPTLRRFYNALLELGPAYGVILNARKCEIICRDEDRSDAALLFPEIPSHKYHSFLDWSLLGSPMGDPEAFSKAVVDRAIRKTKVIAATAVHPHVAMVLLVFCGSSCLVVHLMRSCGSSMHLARFDSAVEAAAAHIAGFRSPFLALPQREGGAGLRSSRLHADAALVASATASSSNAPLFVPPTLQLPIDPSAFAALSSLQSAPLSCACADSASAYFALAFPVVNGVVGRSGARFTDKKQREWSALIDKALLNSLRPLMTTVDSARVNSASSPGASAWLSIPIDDRVTKIEWLKPSEFSVAFRFRFGQPLHPGPSCECVLCRGRSEADPEGHHSSCCLGSGVHTAAHHQLRNWIFALASSALQTPKVEQCPFPLIPSARIDVFLAAVREAVDNAIISPFTRAHLVAAATSPGGHCLAYENSKFVTYGAAANDAHIKLTAAVFDWIGASSPGARALVLRLARLRAVRFNASVPGSLSATLRDLSLVIQRGLASLLTPNATLLHESAPSPLPSQDLADSTDALPVPVANGTAP